MRGLNEGRLFTKGRSILRQFTLWMTIFFAAYCLLIWAMLHWVGERNIATAFCLYLPPGIWLLPCIPLLVLGIFFHWRSLIVQLVLIGFFTWQWLGYRVEVGGKSSVVNGAQKYLTVMTYNRGQNMNQSLQPFKNATHPDVVVLQEATGRADGFLRSPNYAEFGHAVSMGEFTLLSRYPIKEQKLLQSAGSQRAARAARFVIDWDGQLISIYAVHLMTPRDVLRSYMRGAFLWGVIGLPGTPWAEKRRYYQSFWDGQIEDTQMIIDAACADSHPCILAGDFNAPHIGYLHQMLTRELQDAHALAGHGFGFTFPGVTHNPLSLGGPWMRIDYIFYDRRWEALECITESNRPSQHRAVAAKLRRINAGPSNEILLKN